MFHRQSIESSEPMEGTTLDTLSRADRPNAFEERHFEADGFQTLKSGQSGGSFFSANITFLQRQPKRHPRILVNIFSLGFHFKPQQRHLYFLHLHDI